MNARRNFSVSRAGFAGWRDVGRTSQTGSAPMPRARKHNRRRLLAIPALVGISLAGAFGVVSAVKAVRTGDVMPVRSIAVRGVDEDRSREVRAYADVKLGTPLFGIDLDEVAGRVREHPFVRAVTVRRVPPDGLEIEVTERKPIALVAAGALYLVDGAGTPFKRALPGDGLDLPVVTGLAPGDFEEGPPALLGTALEAIAAYEASDRAGGRLSEVHVEEGRGATLVLDGGLRVAIGDELFAERLSRLGRVLDALSAQGRAASSIHLGGGRRPERVAVRLKAPAEMTARNGT